MSLEIGIAFLFKTKVHPHRYQKLDRKVRYLVSLVLEDVEHHRDYSQLDHLHPWLL
jgi:hypothetical protein